MARIASLRRVATVMMMTISAGIWGTAGTIGELNVNSIIRDKITQRFWMMNNRSSLPRQARDGYETRRELILKKGCVCVCCRLGTKRQTADQTLSGGNLGLKVCVDAHRCNPGSRPIRVFIGQKTAAALTLHLSCTSPAVHPEPVLAKYPSSRII